MRSSRLPSAMLLSLLIAISSSGSPARWRPTVSASRQRRKHRRRRPGRSRCRRCARCARNGSRGSRRWRAAEEIASRSAAVRGQPDDQDQAAAGPRVPREHRLRRAGRWTEISRAAAQHPAQGEGRARRARASPARVERGEVTPIQPPAASSNLVILTPPAAAPAPSASFEGLDFANWGAGHPPDTNGDVGPTYYIQTINTSIGIFDKATGVRVAAFTFNTLHEPGQLRQPVRHRTTSAIRSCSTTPSRTAGSSPTSPSSSTAAATSSTRPARSSASPSRRPAIPSPAAGTSTRSQLTGGLDDYPKFGIWPDGIYMSANMFGYAAGGAFQNARVWAFNKAADVRRAPRPCRSSSFDVAPARRLHASCPSNARLQTGTPPRRHAELLRLDVAASLNARQRLEVPRRLGQHVDFDVHRARHPDRRHELAQRRAARTLPTQGGNDARHARRSAR